MWTISCFSTLSSAPHPATLNWLFPTGAIKDLAFSSNSIEQVFKIYAKKVTNYVADTKVPELLYFDMSMHSSEGGLLL